jgi:hypothetical protein
LFEISFVQRELKNTSAGQGDALLTESVLLCDSRRKGS